MKDNIALIGFMGSGKTTVGKILAKNMDMKFVDIDKKISAEEKMSINDIFDKFGERYFREIEREITLREASGNNTIISTGGGVIIDNYNIKNLKKTSFVVYLNATFDCIENRIKNSRTRPLADEKMHDLYESRKMLYAISCDCIIDIDSESNMYDTASQIKDAYINS